MPPISLTYMFKAVFEADSSLKKQLARGAGGAFAIKITAMASAFVLQVVLARMLGLENFGVYVYALTWMNFSAMVGRLGLDTASLRFVAAYNGTQNWTKLSGFISFTNRTVLIFGLIVGLAAIGLFYFLGSTTETTMVRSIWIACLILTPLNAIILTKNSQLRGLKCIVPSQAANDVLRPLLILTILPILFLIFPSHVNAPIALGAHAISACIVLGLMHVMLNRHINPSVKDAGTDNDFRNWLLTALPFLGIALANLIIAQADLLMLGALASPTEAGLYAPARRIGNLITMVLTSVNAIAAPMFAELHAQGKMKDLQETVRMAGKWIFIFSVPCCIAVMVFAKPLLFLFGPEFVNGYRALQIIAGAQLINALAGSVGFLMMMSGHQNRASFLMVLCALGNIALNYLWIPSYGIIGAAWANFVTTVFWNTMMLFFTLKYLRINPTVFRKLTR